MPTLYRSPPPLVNLPALPLHVFSYNRLSLFCNIFSLPYFLISSFVSIVFLAFTSTPFLSLPSHSLFLNHIKHFPFSVFFTSMYPYHIFSCQYHSSLHINVVSKFVFHLFSLPIYKKSPLSQLYFLFTSLNFSLPFTQRRIYITFPSHSHSLFSHRHLSVLCNPVFYWPLFYLRTLSLGFTLHPSHPSLPCICIHPLFVSLSSPAAPLLLFSLPLLALLHRSWPPYRLPSKTSSLTIQPGLLSITPLHFTFLLASLLSPLSPWCL